MLDTNGTTYQLLRRLRHPLRTWREFRRNTSKNSIFHDKADLHACSLFPEALLKGVHSLVKPASVLDMGCGTGRSLDWFVEHGLDVVGVEGSSLAIANAKHPELILQKDLNQELNLGRRFDLVWCFEVAEHIHPVYVDNFTRALTRHSDVILMSAAHPGQGGTGHFNEQPRSYWLDKMRALGYDHDDEGCRQMIAGWEWYPENVFLFRKRP